MLPAKSKHSVGALVLQMVVLLIPIVSMVVLFESKAHAVPSYTRQTGLACSACHYAPPELNAFGRKFKADGYVFTTKPQITAEKTGRDGGLNLLEVLPLSGLFWTSFTLIQAPQPNTQNGNFQFPQQASLFLAGSWGKHLGSFAQVTYSANANHFSWDNTDIRYADNERQLFGKPLTYGLDFNNNPTVEDLWNSTPAWPPYITTNVAPRPSATAVINGALSQDVAGIGAYAFWNDHWYLLGMAYRSEHLGGPQPIPGAPNNSFTFNISGVAPYWRFAYQTATTNNNLEVGTYGIQMKSYPQAVTGPRNSYTDWAVDFQFDRTITIPEFRNDVFSLRGTYIRENSALVGTFDSGGATQPGHHLNTVQGNAEYHFGNRFIFTGVFFSTTGTRDPLLFAPARVFGSATGSPSSTGYIADVSWWPQQNFKFTAQYTGYTRFNGRGTNYDGFGRDASANNFVYLAAFFTF